MTTGQILEKIKDKHGKSALRDGQSLLGLFQDYSHNQLRPQANALRTFLDCKGNQRILNLCSEPSQKQQTEYHRLVQEMAGDYNMQEATAADVCAAFWRVAIGTEPPVLQSSPEPKTAPASKQEPVPQKYPKSPSEPRMRQMQKLSHTPLEITAFSIGWLLIGLILIPFVSALLENPNPVSNPFLFVPIIGVALFGGMQYLLWKQKILQWGVFYPFGLTAFFGLMMVFLVPGMVLENNRAFTLMDAGLEVGGQYLFLWNLIPILEKRKIKRGGKK